MRMARLFFLFFPFGQDGLCGISGLGNVGEIELRRNRARLDAGCRGARMGRGFCSMLKMRTDLCRFIFFERT